MLERVLRKGVVGKERAVGRGGVEARSPSLLRVSVRTVPNSTPLHRATVQASTRAGSCARRPARADRRGADEAALAVASPLAHA